MSKSDYKNRIDVRDNWCVYVLSDEKEEYWYCGITKQKNLDLRIGQQLGRNVGIAKRTPWCEQHNMTKIHAIKLFENVNGLHLSNSVERQMTALLKNVYGDDKVAGYIED